MNYEEVKEHYCNMFLKNVPDNEVEIIRDAFYTFFDSEYKETLTKELNLGEKRTLNFLDLRIGLHAEDDVDEKKRFLMIDPEFNKLFAVSRELFFKAKAKLNGELNNISEKEYIEYIKKITQSFCEVQDFNYDRAEREYSEALLDLEYLIEDTNIVSLRLNREMERGKVR